MTRAHPTPTQQGGAGEPVYLLLDASVLVELLIDGTWRDAATRLQDHLRRETAPAPVTASHALAEATNVLRRLSRRGALPEVAADIALGGLLDLDLVLDPPGPRIPRAWELRDTMTTYDAIYAAAAEALALPLISTDERLIRACTTVSIPAIHLRDAFPAGSANQHK
jgi:predicted nucleic acid-binding protein